MVFPVFFIFALAIAALLIATVAVYLQIYKNHINKALNAKAKPRTMAPPYKVAVALTVMILLIGVFASFLAGYKVAYDRFENSDITFDVRSFYAKVNKIGENTITVNGISLNDEEYRGEFSYDVHEGVSIVRKDVPIDLTDVEVGDLVCVTLLTAGGDVTDIIKIQVLG